MNLEKWLKLNIKKRLAHVFLSVLVLVLPLVLVTNYFYHQYQLEKFLATSHKPMLVALQTGDLISLQKTLSYLKEDSKIVDFQVYDSFGQKILSKNETSLLNSEHFTFKLREDIFSSSGQSFGSIIITWKINYFQIISGLILLGIIIFSVYFIIHRKLIALAYQISDSIKNLPADVDHGKPSHLFNEIYELNEVYHKLVVAKENIILNESLNHQLKQQESLTRIAQKLAHDIRSPISSLNIIASKIENSDLKDLQKQVVQRINDIAEELLASARNNTVKAGAKRVSVSEFCQLLRKEYELQLDKSGISFFCDEQIRNEEVKNIKVLYPIIKNLINNSIEATESKNRKIQVCFEALGYDKEALRFQQRGYQIRVNDNGKGIPEAIQQKLGQEVVSFGKDHLHKSGNGIAIWNAYKDLSAIKAQLSFFSKPGENTEFKILIPST